MTVFEYFRSVTGLDTLKVISSVPKLKSVLPVRVSAPMLTFLSLEKVSVVSAVILSTDQTESVTDRKTASTER